jgi:hypothetical protein
MHQYYFSNYKGGLKLYVAYSESHKKLYEEYFSKTLPDEFEVVVFEISQECPTGEFKNLGWDRMCYQKVLLFERACIENLGGVFVFSDVDIQFFGDIREALLEELGDSDIACQNDVYGYCSGLFICRCNESTLKMFSEMKKNFDGDDQRTLNKHIHLVKAKCLSNRFFTVGHILGSRWIGQDFEIPYPILVHHSNWTVGIDNKTKLMNIVREKVGI